MATKATYIKKGKQQQGMRPIANPLVHGNNETICDIFQNDV